MLNSPIAVGLTALAVIFGGCLLGFAIGKRLKDKHRNSATERVVQGSVSTISLIAALVLGLMVATAKGKFDAANTQIERYAGNLMLLDSELLKFGPDTDEITNLLEKYTIAKIASTWRLKNGPKPEPRDPPAWYLLDKMRQGILSLSPENEYQRSLVRNSAQIVDDLLKMRWLQVAQDADAPPAAFLWVLTGWLCVVYIGLGLYAPRNRVALLSLFASAVSIAVAIVLIGDLDMPWSGILSVSPRPLLKALEVISSGAVGLGSAI